MKNERPMMTRAERQELGQLIRKRERVMKSHASERSATLLADYDAQSAKIYEFDEDATWQAAHQEALAAVTKAREIISERCEALGIPREFAPTMEVAWFGRGQNALAQRRAEFRRAAKSRIEAIEQEAVTRIERMSLEAQTEILASGLESDAAKNFLSSMPSMDTLMPRIEFEEVKKLVETKNAERKQSWLN